ncbi:MAG: CDP-alcohol phosphatidyltransferase family protein [Kiloniellaceae bacterium]
MPRQIRVQPAARERGLAPPRGSAVQVEKLRARLHAGIEQALMPVTDALNRLGVRPNQVTVAGALVSLIAAVLVLYDRLALAGIVWFAGSALDLLDGALARRQGKATAGGAFLDSTLDRVSEGAMFVAIAYHFAELGRPIDAALAVLALLGSVLISYTRARAEALGAQCNVGIVTRAERIVLLGLGLCLDVLAPAVYLLFVVTAVSTVQRIHHTLQTLR